MRLVVVEVRRMIGVLRVGAVLGKRGLEVPRLRLADSSATLGLLQRHSRFEEGGSADGMITMDGGR